MWLQKTSVDAAYCYRSSSMVCLSVGRSITVVSPAKRLNRSRCRLGCGRVDLGGPKETYLVECTLAPPDE